MGLCFYREAQVRLSVGVCGAGPGYQTTLPGSSAFPGCLLSGRSQEVPGERGR